MKYKVRALKVGSLFYYRGGFTSDQEQYKVKEEFPVLVYLIQGNGRNILVDTGGGDPENEDMKRGKHAGTVRKKEERSDKVLQMAGICPEEIDTVILTHLHWDHCYNNHLFPKAEFVVQKEEIMDAVAPLPKFAFMYESFSAGMIPPWARQRTKWKIINGDWELCEGIHLCLLPGHTMGLQGVLADTEEGRVLIASDAVPLYECLDGLDQGNYRISSLCTELRKYYQTFDRLRQMKKDGVKILAGHDFQTLVETEQL